MNGFGSIEIAGKKVPRLGYGTMQLTGIGYWGKISKEEKKNAIQIIRKAYELGIRHFDTADAYGPYLAEELVRVALYPYKDDLLIATKGGFTRQGSGLWKPVGRPEYLQQCVEMSLRRLCMDQIPLYYLHRIDPDVPLEDQLGILDILKNQGKIKHIGLSKVGVREIKKSLSITHIAAIQNKLNPSNTDADVIQFCEHEMIPYVAYSPFSGGETFANVDKVCQMSIAKQVIAWILDQSQVVSVIPSTTSAEHLNQICLKIGNDQSQPIFDH